MEAVWQKAAAAGPANHAARYDGWGATMRRDRYGTTDEGGWRIDYIFPLGQGGGHYLQNLIPMRWQNSVKRTGEYPGFEPAIRGQRPSALRPNAVDARTLRTRATDAIVADGGSP